MKATELRLGITCYFTEPNDDDVTDCYIDTIDNHDLLRHLETGLPVFNPIPLTEEWLIKFGFEWNHGDWIINDVRISECEENEGETVFKIQLSHSIEKQIEHVHQLQNLYFSLTNEELL